jgi:hypothetical protein
MGSFRKPLDTTLKGRDAALALRNSVKRTGA